MKRILYLPLFIIFIFSCGKSGLDEVLIDPKNANEVAKIILTPEGGETKQGTPPVSTTTSGTLVLNTQPDATNAGTQSNSTSQTVTAAQGGTVYLTMRYACSATACESIRTTLKALGIPYCIYRIKGSDFYKIFQYTKKFGSYGNLQFPFTLPDNIGNGAFEVEFSIVDEFGLVTNYNTTTVNVKRLADADNPAKAYGCDFTKISNELTPILNKLVNGSFNATDCEIFKIKYNQVIQAMLKCNQIPQSDKNQLIEANKSVQGLTCR
jgi:hypothetical protein